MIRHIIAAIATLLALWAAYFVYTIDATSQKMKQIEEVIAKSRVKVHLQNNSVTPIQKKSETNLQEERKKADEEVQKKLKALRDRAGSAMAFKVSPLYKQKCSSCHGVNGGGIVGPKLIGKSEEYVYQALIDFKSGKRKNYVMYGLLTKMSDEDLKALSKEISTFEAKMKEAAAQ